MEARSRATGRGPLGRLPSGLLGGVPLALIVAALVALAALGGDSLAERTGPPIEELAVERTELRPGEIELTVRNTGPDAVDGRARSSSTTPTSTSTAPTRRVGRLGSETLTLDYPVAGGLAVRWSRS